MSQAKAIEPPSPSADTTTAVILRASQVKRVFQMGDSEVSVLRHCDIAIKSGEFVAIEGRSGSGKSTLMHILGGLDAVDGGSVKYEGTDYTRLTLNARKQLWPSTLRWLHDSFFNPSKWVVRGIGTLIAINIALVTSPLLHLLLGEEPPIALKWLRLIVFGVVLIPSIIIAWRLFWISQWIVRLIGRCHEMATGRYPGGRQRICAKLCNQRFGFVFQFYHLVPELDVVQNTLLAPMIERSSFSYLFQRSKLRSKAKELLTQLGMGHRLTHRPSQLSGGERQRVAIARALMNNPKVLFADEPTGNLDADTGRQIMKVLEDLHRNHGQTIVMVTHDRALARTADRVLVLTDGHLEQAK